MTTPKIAVVPAHPDIERAVAEAGGAVADPSEAAGIIWVDPRDPEGLRETLTRSQARWVQLPFAGIESFVEAGVIDSNITWTCAKGIYGHATAEHALALILAAARAIHRHSQAKKWIPSGELQTTRQLAGTTVLIIGTGGIGTALAGLLAPLGPRILATNRSGTPMPGAIKTRPISELAKLLPEADWVVLAAPLTGETKNLMDATAIELMKPDAWIVNVARGGLINTEALVAALRAGRIGGAALDVTDPEPLPDGHPLWDLENVVITSHAGNTLAMAIPELRELVKRNVRHFARSESLEGLVDVAAGY